MTSPISYDPVAPQPRGARKICENSDLLPIGINFSEMAWLGANSFAASPRQARRNPAPLCISRIKGCGSSKHRNGLPHDDPPTRPP
jgi:hypothetical protein